MLAIALRTRHIRETPSCRIWPQSGMATSGRSASKCGFGSAIRMATLKGCRQENIKYFASQRRTFERMKSNIDRGLKRKSLKLDALQRRSNELRSQIRSTKQTLLADGRVPSAAAIRQRGVLEERLEELFRSNV